MRYVKRPIRVPVVHCETSPFCEKECLPFYEDCDYIFENTLVIPRREGGNVIQWTLGEKIRDEGPYEYTLQHLHTSGDPGQKDRPYEDIMTAEDVCFLYDLKPRLPGVHSFTHYRIKLKTAERIYYSKPLHTYGNLNYKEWAEMDSILRAEGVQLSLDGNPGWLLKRKISGIPCKKCRDFNTGDVKDGNCPFCMGTGWLGGYYKPYDCFYITIENKDVTINPSPTGPAMNGRIGGRAIAAPVLMTGDVWVDKKSSERFRIFNLQQVVEIKGVPVVYKLTLDKIAFSDIIYDFPLEARNLSGG